MKNHVIKEIEQAMVGILNNGQMERLHEVLFHVFWNKEINEKNPKTNHKTENIDYQKLFLSAKQVEGCSPKSLKYYKTTLQNVFTSISKPIKQIETEDIRSYLAEYETKSNACKTTLDNIRRIISSFFSWMEDENYIIKSPARRIHKIRTGKTVKSVYSDEELEKMRDHCANIRDLAIIDILASTGMRVGELININIADIDFEKRECVVLGKGNKERTVYFDARTKIHLKNYVDSRIDTNPALFVTINRPNNRLQISAVEIRLRELGKSLNIDKVHPHKFRRTLATKAIDKGMPIEQVQVLLGHTKIDTTLQYAMVSQNNVKMAHQKYIG